MSKPSSNDNPKKRIAILGGGSSGLISIKTCLEEGYEPICFELQSHLGGLWKYRDEDVEGLASVMRSTIINSSKEMSAFSDFPPPTEFSNYMHNSSMIKYIELYAERFGLRDYIRFRHEIIEVVRAKDYDATGRWNVKVRELDTNNEFEDVFDGVMVCTGHHVFPHQPTFEGMDQFRGRIIHTHSYKKPAGYEDKNVVVVGVGNSGGDVAVELSAIAEKVYLSTRRGAWIIHRVGPNGLPFDAQYIRRTYNCLFSYLPFDLSVAFSEYNINQRFDHKIYNLKPKHSLYGQHPMVNDALPNRILSGTVIIKNDIHHFTPNGVVFVGEEEKEYEADEVVLATGYQVKFPYIGKDVFNPEENRCDLYKYVFPPQLKHPSLCFIGLAQPVGPLFPISENQARWYIQLMAKNVSLPSEEDMRKDIASKERDMAKRYFEGPRNTLQIDWLPYMDEIASLYGVKPNLSKLLFTDPKLFWACFYGPCVPYQYRLNGPRPWTGAREAILQYDERVLGAFNTRIVPKADKEEEDTSSRFVKFMMFLLVVIVTMLFAALV